MSILIYPVERNHCHHDIGSGSKMMASTLTASVRRIAVWSVAGFIAISASMYLSSGFNLPLDLYRQWFGLSPTSTVADYRAASEGAKSYWLDRMCNNGVCLHRVDWECGFSMAPAHPVEFDPDVEVFNANVRKCFTGLVAKAPLADNLGKLRLICGRRHMVFAGETYSDPKKCAEAGGQWGKKITVFADED
jgi:hypothetical protein